MVRWPLILVVGVVISCVILQGPVARATHETGHRFTIFGTVRDGRSFPGQPLAGREIRFSHPKTDEPWEIVDTQGNSRPRVTTDREGSYSAILHVHDENLGATVKIVVDGTQKELVLTFDPRDQQTERRTRVDIVVFPK